MVQINEKEWVLILISGVIGAIISKYLQFNNLTITNIAIVNDAIGGLVIGLIILFIVWAGLKIIRVID